MYNIYNIYTIFVDMFYVYVQSEEAGKESKDARGHEELGD